jgi:hypothetical protein
MPARFTADEARDSPCHVLPFPRVRRNRRRPRRQWWRQGLHRWPRRRHPWRGRSQQLHQHRHSVPLTEIASAIAGTDPGGTQNPAGPGPSGAVRARGYRRASVMAAIQAALSTTKKTTSPADTWMMRRVLPPSNDSLETVASRIPMISVRALCSACFVIEPGDAVTRHYRAIFTVKSAGPGVSVDGSVLVYSISLHKRNGKQENGEL